MAETSLKPFVTIDAVSRHFNVSVSSIRAWIARGYITPKAFIRVGKRGQIRFDLAKTVADLEAHSQKAAAEAAANGEPELALGKTPIVDATAD